MKIFKQLFQLTGGFILDEEENGPAVRMRLALVAALASIIFAAFYGLLVGSADMGLALGNLYKLPMTVLLSGVIAVPAGLVTWKLTGAKINATSLLLSLASGIFTGTLVLAASAPVVALYYHTSGFWGTPLALGAAGLACVVGQAVFVIAAMRRRDEECTKTSVGMPVGVMVTFQMIALVQLIALASPILPESTPLSGGVDELASANDLKQRGDEIIIPRGKEPMPSPDTKATQEGF